MTVPEQWTGDECRDVMSAIPVYVWSALPDGTVDFVNPQWQQYTGLPASAAFGWKWESVIHAEDVDRYTSAWRSSLDSLHPLEQEIRVLSKNGVYRWWLIRCTPAYGSSGQLQRWYGAGFDIDDRKRVQEELQRNDEIVHDRIEQELRDTIDAIPVLCGTLSSDGNVDFFNRRTLEYYGLSSEQMIGFNWKNVVHPDDLPRLVAAQQESFPAGRSLDIETRCRRADGVYRWVIHRIVPRYDERGEIVKWYGITFDIEDRKRAEEAVLEQRVFERTRIARDLHDTLLQNFQATLLMLGAAKNLLDGGPVKEALEQALVKADRAIAEGRDAIQGLRLGAEEPGDLITVLTTLGKGLAAGLETVGGPAFHVEVSGIPARLHPSVIHEVVSIGSEALRNAFRHARAKHIWLHFLYEAAEFRLAVVDDGIGIDPTILVKGRGEGHFGLAGMRERAKIVSGEFAPWSELEVGTRIELKIQAPHAYDVS
ncbi:PAS domain-containing sensor histidine kinase [Acidicapsa ligni]|uniref:PAS domain-containing sensor histidine kinase n=1 Tax=Acidicapsa ligni TaxID=542300 RepID=UPI0021DF706D|nr:PAS domain-containing protein [Acidicapsa ligni]